MNLQDKIIKEVANTLQIDHELSDRVCKSVFELLVEIMREEEYKPYRIQGLGKFEVKPYTRKRFESKKKQRQEREKRNKELYDSIGSGSTTEPHGCKNGGMDTKE